MGKKYYRINENIRANQLRVIDDQGKQVGVLSREEALKKAREEEVDLVEIAPTAVPPVAKIIDFKKFLYQEEKKERKAKKSIRGGELKGVRLSPFMAQGDYEFRKKRIEEFLKEGNKVRVVVRFKGRQMGKKEFGYNLLKRLIEEIKEAGQTEGEPKWFGKDLALTFSPVKTQSINKGEKHEKQEENKEISQPPL